jgi:eukaryotic-like serine/threonine-protein kinase
MLLAEPDPGTTTPAQPPAQNSPAATSAPPSAAPPSALPSSAPLAGSGKPAPAPRVSESAALEPAAVTHPGPAGPPKDPKADKPGKTGNNGKAKGNGPGHNDS